MKENEGKKRSGVQCHIIWYPLIYYLHDITPCIIDRFTQNRTITYKMNLTLGWGRLETRDWEETVYWGHESRDKLGHFCVSLLAIWLLFETSRVGWRPSVGQLERLQDTLASLATPSRSQDPTDGLKGRDFRRFIRFQLPLKPKKAFYKNSPKKVIPKKIPCNVESVILLSDSSSRRRISEIFKALRLSRYRG